MPCFMRSSSYQGKYVISSSQDSLSSSFKAGFHGEKVILVSLYPSLSIRRLPHIPFASPSAYSFIRLILFLLASILTSVKVTTLLSFILIEHTRSFILLSFICYFQLLAVECNFLLEREPAYKLTQMAILVLNPRRHETKKSYFQGQNHKEVCILSVQDNRAAVHSDLHGQGGGFARPDDSVKWILIHLFSYSTVP